MAKWEIIHDVAFERVRRMPVIGGWLYQTEIDQDIESLRHDGERQRVTGWHPPVFVPEAK